MEAVSEYQLRDGNGGNAADLTTTAHTSDRLRFVTGNFANDILRLGFCGTFYFRICIRINQGVNVNTAD